MEEVTGNPRSRLNSQRTPELADGNEAQTSDLTHSVSFVVRRETCKHSVSKGVLIAQNMCLI